MYTVPVCPYALGVKPPSSHSRTVWQKARPISVVPSARQRIRQLSSTRRCTTAASALSVDNITSTNSGRPRTTSYSSQSDGELRRKVAQAAIDLREHGWAVLDGILPQSECDRYVDSLWSWMEHLGTGVNRNDPSTWTPDRWPPTYRGILNTLEIGHQDFVWRVRKHERVTKVFEMLWGTSELLSSFDAINLLGPHNEAPPAGWLHVDQAPTRPQLACIQGILNVSAVSADTSGTLLVKNESHKAHQDFFYNAAGLSEDELNRIPDHFPFTPEQVGYWDSFDSIGLVGNPGSLFIWDSRTSHSNTVPQQITDWRHVVYCCYQPRDMASERDLRLKQIAWDNYSLTTHLPAQNIRIYDADFAKQYANEAKVMDKDLSHYSSKRTRDNVEDATLRRLAGVEPYPEADIRRATPLVELSLDELTAMLKSV